MANPRQPRNLIFGLSSGAAGAALALAIMLVAAVLATGSAQAQTYSYSVLYTFTGSPDGAHPAASLLRDAQGNLYGTTSAGGDPACTNGCGTVFKVDATGKETLLYTFTGSPDGAIPLSGLVRDAQGNLYGTTGYGGASDNGTVFEVDTTGKETVLYSFTGTGGDGAGPVAGLVRDAQGILYGTALVGGAYGAGTVFELRPSPTACKAALCPWTETVLYSFTGTGGDGNGPTTRLVRDAQGNLYGTTQSGGDSNDDGTVFKVDAIGKETVLYSLTGTGGDGLDPQGDLVQDAQGNLLGTTWGGGAYGAGTVFKVDTTGNETVLYSFNGGGDGGYPIGPGVVQDAQGNLYGATTSGGGPENAGTVFRL